MVLLTLSKRSQVAAKCSWADDGFVWDSRFWELFEVSVVMLTIQVNA
jgi:hypothetical protein